MEDTAVRIFWAADSTVQTNDITTYPQTGIGQVFSLYTREGVVLSNHAKNGRSTKSFMDEGRLAVIEGQMYIKAARKHHAHPLLIPPSSAGALWTRGIWGWAPTRIMWRR